MTFEKQVREFYDVASEWYEQLMSDRWHHGDPEAEAQGKPFIKACEALEEELLAQSGLTTHGWALDFGSGIGGPTCHMARKSGARFVGVSNNEKINRKARERAAANGLGERASFLTLGDTDYKNLPFADDSFDAVFFLESVCHLSDKASFFRQAHRVLKRGGRLVGTDWLQRPFGSNLDEAQIMQYIGPVNEHIRIPWLGTVERYRGMLQDAGLKVLVARDMFPGARARGSNPTDQCLGWLSHSDSNAELFLKGKLALDEARKAGVFTAGMFVAEKPR